MVFWMSDRGTVAFVLGSVLFPDRMASVSNAVFTWTATMWTWLYLLAVFFLVTGYFVLMGLACGTMKLRLPEGRPKFFNFSWFGMLFGSANSAAVSLALFSLFKGLNPYKNKSRETTHINQWAVGSECKEEPSCMTECRN